MTAFAKGKNISNKMFIFAISVILIIAAGFFGFNFIPLSQMSAKADLANPEKDFVGQITSQSVGFVPGNGVTATHYELGMSDIQGEAYRISSINTNNMNKEYGIYEDYYSEASVLKIINAFKLRQYVFTSEDDGAGSYNTITTTTDFPIKFSGEGAILTESSVTGKRWDGSTYTGTIAGIDAAGTYQITSMTVNYNQNIKQISNPHLMIIFKAKLIINKNVFEPLFTGGKQYNLNSTQRTYGEQTNLRNLINIHNTTPESGKFYFSGTENYFRLKNFGKNQAGVVVDKDTDTNLAYVKDYLEVLWYEYSITQNGPMRNIINDETITKAREYSISLGWTVTFDAFADYSYNDPNTNDLVDLSKIVEVLYEDNDTSVDFYKEITILKRKIHFSENLSQTGGFNGGVNIKREVEYLPIKTVAEALFSGCSIDSEEMWVALNGLQSDYTMLSSVLNNRPVSVFTGSYFNVFTIGEHQGVNMRININKANLGQSILDVIDNYEAVMGYYIGSNYYQFSSFVNEGELFYELTTKSSGDTVYFNGKFRITPNNVSFIFSNQSINTYGEKETILDYNFNSLINISGIIHTPNWEIILVSGLVGTKAQRSQTVNRIYVGVMTGKRNNEATKNIVYVDGDGNKYTMYDARLYAGDYYFYYDVYVMHSSTSSSYEGKITPNNGIFEIKDRNNNGVAFLNLDVLQLLSINKLKLSVNIDSMDTIKNYDGTTVLNNFSASLAGGNIFPSDASNITCYINANYLDSRAGDNVTIVPDFKINYTEAGQRAIDDAINAGNDEKETIAYRTKNSYDLDTIDIGGVWSATGKINKLPLKVAIVDNIKTAVVDGTVYPLYTRNYAENSYVLLQVARKGEILPDGSVAGENYYFYYYSRTNCGVLGESKISLNSALGVNTDNCIKLSINGFLLGEGFKWDKSGDLVDFNTNTKVDINFIFSWFDSIKGVPINSNTNSSQNEDDYYRIEYSPSGNLYSLFYNYKIVNTGSEYAFLHIGKLDLGPNFIFIQQDANELYYEYNSNSQIGNTVTYSGENNALFNFSGHYEWLDIVETLNAQGKTLADLVTVIDFYRDCDSECGHPSYDLQNPDIKFMKISGNYTLQFELPSSKNYKGGTFAASLKVKGKNVQSIITFAVRTYQESNPSFDASYDKVVYVNTLRELELKSYFVAFHETYYEVLAYAALDGETVKYYSIEDDRLLTMGELQDMNAIKVYMHNYNRETGTMDNTIIYYGFIDSDKFTSSDITHNINFALNSENDRAYTSGLVNGITATGAFKHNYNVADSNDKLYVMKKSLSIIVSETEQSSIYSGNEKIPVYVLDGGNSSVGYLGISIMSYTYNGETIYSNLPSSVLEVGIYELELYARPHEAYSINYATSRETTLITYTVTPLQLLFIGEDITITYTNTIFVLNEFDYYFDGKNSNWGTVEITEILKDGIFVDEIKESGVYNVTILGILKEEYRKNLYFEMDGENYIYSKSYSFIVTVKASSSYEFILTSEIGVSLPEPYKGYSFNYNGKVYVPTYTFINLLSEVELSVSYIVINSKMEINPEIKGTETYTLIFEINKTSNLDYNPNYATYEGDEALEFIIRIDKAPLYVTIGLEEGYEAKKTYLDDNSVIEEHMFFKYEGWVNGENGTEPLNIIMHPPVIDWDFFDGDKIITIETETVAGKYSIKPKNGAYTQDLANYYFDYAGSFIIFEIEKAVPYLLVYGLYDQETDTYHDYYIYTGKKLEPKIKRRYKDAFVNEEIDMINNSDVIITYEGKFIGSDKNNISENDINRVGEYCIDVGEYVFSVSIPASHNYTEIPASYYYLKVIKSELYITVTGNSDGSGTNRGYANMTYNRTENYPTFEILYTGFLGKDDLVSTYKNPYKIYSYNLRQNTTGITGLGLTHPIYKIHARQDISDTDITPYDAGTYYVELFFNDIYGVCQNYNINVSYLVSEEVIKYPELVINKRVLDIKSEERVVKTYDGTVKILSGAITKNNYSFIKKSGIEESGVVQGDEENINLSINYSLSRYERKNVFDEYGIASDIKIRIYGYSIDNNNYRLNITNYFNDELGNYFYLYGSITQANAKIDFYDEQNNIVIGKVKAVYDSNTHALRPEVKGVNGEILQKNAGFTILYSSSNYSSENEPSEAGEYTVTVTIIDNNYVNSKISVVLEIEKAEVEITFNGDASPIYATNNMGLVAFATGVGEYYQNLAVSYYDSDKKFISNILKADAGIYTAVAIHNASTNFKYKAESTIFTIRLRTVSAASDIASKYPYTGKMIIPKFTFQFNNITYYPILKFDEILTTAEGKVYQPLNYDEVNVNDKLAPINAGKYRVTAANVYKNYFIANSDIVEFEIVPINLTIGIADTKVNQNEDILFNFTLQGNVNNENISNLETPPVIEYYNNSTGEKLSWKPSAAGIYKVKPAGAVSRNYNISYSFGILTINKSQLVYNSGANETQNNMVIEGSFSADVNIVVKEIKKVEYTSYKAMFDTFKINYPEFIGYNLSTIFYIQFSDGTVELTDSGKMKVKILISDILGPDYLKTLNTNSISHDSAFSMNMSDIEEYYVAHFKSDGTVECIRAEREGDYIVFETNSLEAFCVITNAELSKKNNSWVLYVAISAGVVLIVCSLLLIKKRA